MKEWKITLAQLAPTLMEVRKNAGRALEVMYESARRGSGLIVLPELYLSGYAVSGFIRSEAEKRALRADVAEGLSMLREGGKSQRRTFWSAIRSLKMGRRNHISRLNTSQAGRLSRCTAK